MVDGGKHFNNKEMHELCLKWRTDVHVISAYSPWVNGLIEGTNKLFLHILKCLCAPDLNYKELENMKVEDIPWTWPDHFEETIRILSWHLLPSLKFSPKKLLLGLVINTKPTDIKHSTSPTSVDNVTIQMAYVAQQHLNGYAEAVACALRRKRTFDRRVLTKNQGEVIFLKGQLIQIYWSDLYYTFKMEHKLLPKWSIPQHVVSRNLNSYTLETMKGTPIPGLFSARWLRWFIPKDGTELSREQKVIEEHCQLEEKEQLKGEEMTIAKDRASTNQADTGQVGASGVVPDGTRGDALAYAIKGES